MAGRLFVSRDTLWRLERGDPTVSMGSLATAIFVHQLHDRLANLAAPASDDLALNTVPRCLGPSSLLHSSPFLPRKKLGCTRRLPGPIFSLAPVGGAA
jgi:hypothetical protein